MEVDKDGNPKTRDPSDGTLGGRGNLPSPGGSTDSLNYTNSKCPPECCDAFGENCFRY